MTFNLLLVDDDALFAAAAADELRGWGHAVTVVGAGRDAVAAIRAAAYDAVILDRMLPGLDGMAVVGQLRRDGVTIPILMVSARGRPVERIEGLNAGADDYLAKPVATAELHARLGAIIRGRGWARSAGDDTIRAGDIVVSPTRFRVWRAGRPIDLGKLEFDLLAELARHAGTVLTRATLFERVWGQGGEPASNIVDVYVRRLRLKLAAAGALDPILTMRGVGYMLED